MAILCLIDPGREGSTKSGTKMHLGVENSNLLTAMQK